MTYLYNPEGYIRKARKPWRCMCADAVRSYAVTGRYTHPEHADFLGESTAWASTPQAATEMADRKSKNGPFAATSRLAYVRYDSVTIEPKANPNYRADCLGEIRPGDLHFEYKGESHEYESGHRYCASCALAVFGVDVGKS